MLRLIEPKNGTVCLQLGMATVTTRFHGRQLDHLISVGLLVGSGDECCQTYDGNIYTGPDDVIPGQHACLHENIVGSALCCASIDSARTSYKEVSKDNDIPWVPPYYTISSGGVVGTFTHFVQMCQDFRFIVPCATDASDMPTLVYAAGHWCSDCLVYAAGVSVWDSNRHSYNAHVLYNRFVFNASYSRYRVVSVHIQYADDVSTRLENLVVQMGSDAVLPYPTSEWRSLRSYHPTIYTTSSSAPWIDLQYLSDQISTAVGVIPPPPPDWGELAREAYSQVKTWSGNGIALTHDLLRLREELTTAKKLIGGVKDPTKWASIFLSYKYGLRLTVQDSKNLIKAHLHQYEKNGLAKLTSGSRIMTPSSVIEYHYSLYHRPYDSGLMKLYQKLNTYDMLPDLGNLWDLVPFSFVANWFVDIGGLLDDIDNSQSVSTYDIVGSIKSIKHSRCMTMSNLGFPAFLGNVVVSYYNRAISSSGVQPKFKVDVPINNGFNHWLESTALVVQKIK